MVDNHGVIQQSPYTYAKVFGCKTTNNHSYLAKTAGIQINCIPAVVYIPSPVRKRNLSRVVITPMTVLGVTP